MCKAGDLVLLAIRIDPACWEACKVHIYLLCAADI